MASFRMDSFLLKIKQISSPGPCPEWDLRSKLKCLFNIGLRGGWGGGCCCLLVVWLGTGHLTAWGINFITCQRRKWCCPACQDYWTRELPTKKKTQCHLAQPLSPALSYDWTSASSDHHTPCTLALLELLDFAKLLATSGPLHMLPFFFCLKHLFSHPPSPLPLGLAASQPFWPPIQDRPLLDAAPSLCFDISRRYGYHIMVHEFTFYHCIYNTTLWLYVYKSVTSSIVSFWRKRL